MCVFTAARPTGHLFWQSVRNSTSRGSHFARVLASVWRQKSNFLHLCTVGDAGLVPLSLWKFSLFGAGLLAWNRILHHSSFTRLGTNRAWPLEISRVRGSSHMNNDCVDRISNLLSNSGFEETVSWHLDPSLAKSFESLMTITLLKTHYSVRPTSPWNTLFVWI